MSALPVSKKIVNAANGGEQESTPSTKSFPALEFAKRLDTALHGHPHAPNGHGRQRWLRDLITERTGITVSSEAVRKWFAGEARPRPDVMKKIAQSLEVDEAWLSLGISPAQTPVEARRRNAIAEGAVNLVAGLIQIAGGNIAFPTGEDYGPDLYAIINGRKLDIEVKLARDLPENRVSFAFSPNSKADVLIGVVPLQKGLGAKLLVISKGMLDSEGKPRGGYIEIEVDSRGASWYVGDTTVPIVNSIRSLAEAA